MTIYLISRFEFLASAFLAMILPSLCADPRVAHTNSMSWVLDKFLNSVATSSATQSYSVANESSTSRLFGC